MCLIYILILHTYVVFLHNILIKNYEMVNNTC